MPQARPGKTQLGERTRELKEENTQSANELLDADHERVLDMFRHYETLESEAADAARRGELAERICTELKIHTKIEEDIYYPRVREAIGEKALLNEAIVEHQTAKQLIEQIESMQPDDPLYDARVKVLGEYVRHHIREEREEMFPKAKRAELDTIELANDLRERKRDLQQTLH